MQFMHIWNNLLKIIWYILIACCHFTFDKFLENSFYDYITKTKAYLSNFIIIKWVYAKKKNPKKEYMKNKSPYFHGMKLYQGFQTDDCWNLSQSLWDLSPHKNLRT